MADPVDASGTAPPHEVRAHLERVLASPHFHHSRRCSALLRFVVEHSLDNQGTPIKERILGQAVFDRDLGYDTNQDAVVRNAAAEVRKRLAQYYQETGLATTGLRIELPLGTYVPEFRTAVLPVAPKVEPPTAGSKPWLMLVFGIAAVAALVGWLAGTRYAARRPVTELDQFWAPVLAAHSPVQICVGQSARRYYPDPLPEGPPDPKATVPLSSLVPLRDRFLFYGDAVALAHIGSYLAAHDKLYRVRGSQVTPYAELQGNPVVLIGAFNNDWTIRLTQDLRFSLVNGGPTVRGVRDRERDTDMTWRITRSPQGWIADEDYALVTRVADPHIGQTVISAGGIATYGTQAAGDFLTSPEQFREALRGAPRDWARKNIQVVLEVKVADGTPGPPHVLAAHFW